MSDVAQDVVDFKRLRAQRHRLEAELAPLEARLKAHFRDHPALREIDGVAYAVTARRQLDTAAVRAHLGDKVAEFERVVRSESLSVLGAATTTDSRSCPA